METQQFNLKLPKHFVKLAEAYAEKKGFRNIQELATASMREKIFEEGEFEEGLLTAIASEKVLAKDWLSKDEDEAWKDL